ncbi:MAG: hypothetical protein LBD55_07810 [Treponema sp.]|jgi:hypothetical protein|nr:hypothetical protein [Treponema sp.]
MRSDWVPSRRDDLLSMAKVWLAVLPAKSNEWNIPDSEKAGLETLAAAAEDILAKAKSSDRSPLITALCKDAFDKLTEKMRFIKNRCFVCPPLTPADLISLELKPKDGTRTSVQDPESQVEADIAYPNRGALDLTNIRRLGEPSADRRSEYKVQIRYGALADYGPCSIAAAPKSGDDLPYILTTKRKKERFGFPGYSGKTAYFCLRWLNANDKPGPYGPVLEAIIP